MAELTLLTLITCDRNVSWQIEPSGTTPEALAVQQSSAEANQGEAWDGLSQAANMEMGRVWMKHKDSWVEEEEEEEYFCFFRAAGTAKGLLLW